MRVRSVNGLKDSEKTSECTPAGRVGLAAVGNSQDKYPQKSGIRRVIFIRKWFHFVRGGGFGCISGQNRTSFRAGENAAVRSSSSGCRPPVRRARRDKNSKARSAPPRAADTRFPLSTRFAPHHMHPPLRPLLTVNPSFAPHAFPPVPIVALPRCGCYAFRLNSVGVTSK